MSNVEIKQGFSRDVTFSITGDIVLSEYDISLVVTDSAHTLIQEITSLTIDSVNKKITAPIGTPITDKVGEYKAYFVFKESDIKKVSVPNDFFLISVINDYIKDV